VYADLDNDGDLDIVIGNNNDPVMLYRNNAQEQLNNHYLKIVLRGTGANTAAIGAKVWLYAAGKMQYAEQYPVRGYQSSISPELFFGLGGTAQIDSIVVQWPDGSVARKTSVPADQLLQLSQEPSDIRSLAKKETQNNFPGCYCHFRYQFQTPGK
jgi:ASPIC and UnbV.